MPAVGLHYVTHVTYREVVYPVLARHFGDIYPCSAGLAVKGPLRQRGGRRVSFTGIEPVISRSRAGRASLRPAIY